MKIIKLLSISIVILLLFTTNTNAQQQTLETVIAPDSLAITGTVTNNYVNISYTFTYNHTASATAEETTLLFTLPNALYLSNLSAFMGDLVAWGKVLPIQEAQQIYNDTVSQNKTAIFIENVEGNTYRVNFLLEANAILYIGIYFEGFLTRKLGHYTVDLPALPDLTSINSLLIDIDITTTYATLITANLLNLAGVNKSIIPNGRKLQINATDISIASVKIDYVTASTGNQGTLLTYDNGTNKFFTYYLSADITSITEAQNKEFLFIIDKSGSMAGDRINYAKNAMLQILPKLKSDDYFNIITFSDIIDQLYTKSNIASTANIEEGLSYINSITAGGSTDINSAVLAALNSFKFATEYAKVIFLLSDGVPTAGETNGAVIARNIADHNENASTINTIGIVNDDRKLMQSIAFDNGGIYISIQNPQDLESELAKAFPLFENPVINALSISYTNANNMYPAPRSLFSALYNGSEFIQVGMFTNDLSITVGAHTSVGTETITVTSSSATNGGKFVEKYWAIKALTELVQTYNNYYGDATTIKQQIIQLAVTYGIVVQGFTAFILTFSDNSEDSRSDNDFSQTNTEADSVVPITIIQDPAMTAGNIQAKSPYPVLTLVLLFIIPILLRKKK